MSEFDYLGVLISIVLGLGITQLLSGFARWLELRSTAPIYPPALMWALFLLVVHVQTWWSMFGLRAHNTWTFLQFAVVLAQPILLYLLAALVFPSAGADVRGEAAFNRHRPWFFGLLLALLVLSLAKDLILSGSLPNALNLGFHGAIATCAAVALFVRRNTVQWIAAVAALAVILAYVTLLFGRLA